MFDMKEKKEKWRYIMGSKINLKNMKYQSQQDNEDFLVNDYGSRVYQKIQKQNKLSKKIEDMENREVQLMQQLKTT